MRTNGRIADPKAPRFRREELDILNLDNKQFYKSMKAQHPRLAKYSNADIAKCIELCNVAMAKEVQHNRNGMRLPDGMGIVIAGACKVATETTKKNTNIGVYSETGQAVPHNNLHSDGYVAKVKYSSGVDKHMFDNHDFWMFDGCRNLVRAVSDEFKKGNHLNYIVFSTYSHIAHLFRPDKIKKEDVRATEKKQKRLEQHDEFAFD